MFKYFHKSNWRSLLINRNSFFFVSIIIFVLFVIGSFVGKYFGLLDGKSINAYDLLKELFSNYISLLGIGLAVLAILFAIIQMAFKRLSVVELVIENTYFAPFFYYGAINILICGILILFSKQAFIPEALYIRFVIIENYFFIFSIVFLGIVFYKTFAYLNFSAITDLYIRNVKRAVRIEKEINADEALKQSLQTYNQELVSEVSYLIEENKTVELKKIFHLYLFILKSNASSTLIKGLKWNMVDWFIKANARPETMPIFNDLVGIWWNFYRFTLHSNDTIISDFLKGFPTLIYEKFIETKDAKIKKLVIENFPIRLKEIAIGEILENTTIDKNNYDNVLQKFDRILYEFNSLMKIICEEKDLNSLQIIIQQLELLKQLLNLSDADSDYEMIRLKLRYSGTLTPSEELQFQFFTSLNLKLFAIKFGNLSWLYYRVLNYNDNIKEVQPIIKYLHDYTQIELDLLIEFCSALINNTRQYPEWNTWVWNSEERHEMKAYTLENEELFLAIGFVMLVSQTGYPDYFISDSASKKVDSLIYWSKTVRSRFNNKRDIWKQLFDAKEVIEVENIFSLFETFLNSLNNKREIIINEEIAHEKISHSKVTSFKKLISDQWRQSKNLSDVFEYFKAVEDNPTEKLFYVGLMKMHLKRGKVMFIDKHYQFIHGTDWGRRVNKFVNDFFVNSILNQETIPKIETSNFINAFDYIINEHPSFNLVFISTATSWKIQQEISNSGHFTNSYQLTDKYPFQFVGIYKEQLVIIALLNKSLNEKAISLNLPNAVTLKRRKQKDWEDEVLQVDVIEIDEDKAKEIIKKDHPTLELSKSLLNEIMTGIFVEINETITFEIKNLEEILVTIISK